MMFKQHDDSLFLAGNDRFEGYLADLLFRLSLAIGFDYEIRLSVDSSYGSPGRNGSWTGMVGEVQRSVGGDGHYFISKVLVANDERSLGGNVEIAMSSLPLSVPCPPSVHASCPPLSLHQPPSPVHHSPSTGV